MPKYTETKLRTFTKSIILRVIVFTIITLSTVFIFGQSFMEGIEFGIMDIIIELSVHYGYERIWLGIEWGMVEMEPEQENENI